VAINAETLSGRSRRPVGLPIRAQGPVLVWLETRQVDEARTNSHYLLYIVDNVRQGDPARFGLLTKGGNDLATLLTRAVERHYYTVPFPVATYDRLLGDQDPK
jgi:hypothetical protein